MYAYASLTSPDGGPVREGKELYLSGDGARLWQTAEDAQAEPARLREQFLTFSRRDCPARRCSFPTRTPFLPGMVARLS